MLKFVKRAFGRANVDKENGKGKESKATFSSKKSGVVSC